MPKIAPILDQLLEDWGTHLSLELYKEALCHFLGIEAHKLNHLELNHNGQTGHRRCQPAVTAIHQASKKQASGNCSI